LLAYPTYDIGARLAGAGSLATASTVAFGPSRPDLLWINSPANPTGAVLPVDHLRKVVEWARGRAHGGEAAGSGTVVASDECYADLYYGIDPPPSVLSPEVSDGDHRGLLAVHSLSKRSNLAGYRAGFVAGDRALIARLLEVRKHSGMIVPAPVQAAMVAALGDDSHVIEVRARYAARRERLLAALRGWGLEIEDTGAGLYLWGSCGEDCWQTVARLARLGVLVAPGEFYGAAGSQHVRVALTATDERVAAACARLSSG
jgi:succinyldiaminopimelate transaminase